MNPIGRGTIVLALLVSLSVCSLCSAGLNEKLPAESLVTLEWQGRNLVFDGSLLGQAIQNSNLMQLLSKLATTINEERSPQQIEEDNDKVRQIFSLLDIAWQHPMALAITEINQAGPGGIILIHLGDDKDAFTECWAKFTEEGNLQPGQVGALEFKTVENDPEMPVSFGTMGPVFFLTFGKGQPELLANVTPATSILSNPKYKENMQVVGGSDEQVRVFLDVDRVYHAAARMQNPDAPEDAPLPFLPILSLAGVDRLSTAAGSVRIIDKGLYSKLKLFSPAPHRAALLPLAGAPLNDADLADIPADADFFLAMNMPLSELLAYIDNVCGGGQPDQPGMIEMMFQQVTGVKLQEEFFNAFGDTWVLSSAPSQGGFLTGTVLTLEVKDEELARNVLGKLEDRLAQTLSAEAVNPDAASSLIQTAQFGKADVHYLAIGAMSDAEHFNPGLMIPLQPAWSIHEKKLYIALWPQIIGTALQNPSEKLLQTAEYKTLRSRLSENVSILGYSNNIQMAKRLYPIELLLGSGISNLLKSNLDEDFLLPGTLQESLQYIRPGMVAVTSDDNGVQLESYQGGLSGSMLSGIAPAMTASILLPAMNNARYQAKIVVSSANLNSIGKAILIYSNNENQMPMSFDILVKTEFISVANLFSPLSNRPPPTWDEENNKVVGETDYILIPYKTFPNDGSLLHVYERPENFKPLDPVNVLMVDGSVKRIFREELIQEFARARAELKKQGVDFEFVLPPDLKKQLDDNAKNANPGASEF